ncbi:MAG: hypothetical protein ACKOCM_09405 [Cyanobacteriota bacterium]
MSSCPLPLMIGIGNPLRRDDGVGWRLAAEWGLLQGDQAPARVLAVQQVLPELAETIARHDRVLFIDATCPGSRSRAEAAEADPIIDGPSLQALRPDPTAAGAGVFSHSLDPAVLLALAAELYGHSPKAHRLLLIGRRMTHGTTFSAVLRRQLPAARLLLRQWLEHGDA